MGIWFPPCLLLAVFHPRHFQSCSSLSLRAYISSPSSPGWEKRQWDDAWSFQALPFLILCRRIVGIARGSRNVAVVVSYYSFVAFSHPDHSTSKRPPGSSAVTAGRSMHVMLFHSSRTPPMPADATCIYVCTWTRRRRLPVGHIVAPLVEPHSFSASSTLYVYITSCSLIFCANPHRWSRSLRILPRVFTATRWFN